MIYKRILRANIELAEMTEKIILKSLWKGFDSYICYGGNALNFVDNRGNRLYIRLVYENPNKVSVDIANIFFEQSKRRKGNLSRVFNSLLKQDYIEKIVISDVLSFEMHQFCRKNNMNYYEPYNSYYIDKNS